MKASFPYEDAYLTVNVHKIDSSPHQGSNPGIVRATFMVRIKPHANIQSAAYPNIADRLTELLPGLRTHKCESGASRSMHSELADTELAHLLEHVALECLAQFGLNRLECRGETGWNWALDGERTYRVRIVAPAPSEVVLQAMAQGLAIVNQVLDQYQ